MPRRSRKRRWQYRASRFTSESDRATAVAKLRPSTPRSDRPAALQRRPTTGALPLSGQATVKLRFGRASVETPPAPSLRLPNARETYSLSNPNPMSDPHPPPSSWRKPAPTVTANPAIPHYNNPLRYDESRRPPGRRGVRAGAGARAIKSHPQSPEPPRSPRGVRPAAPRTRSPRTRSVPRRYSPPPVRPERQRPSTPSVIPANAGTHGYGGPGDPVLPYPGPQPWVPASAGMTGDGAGAR